MQAPFSLFSWRRPFLRDLKDMIWKQTRGEPGKVLIIVPNQRPWRYFVDLFPRDGKALMLPKMLPFEEVTAIWRRAGETKAVYNANVLDQVAILGDIIKGLAATDKALAARFAKMEMEVFLPWGFRLASLLEDIFTNGVQPCSLAAPEGELDPLAATLLASLGKIASLWQETLSAHNFTTHGMDCFFASLHADTIPLFLQPGPDRPVYIAGFSTLNGTQKKLFHSLWQAGAQICLHGDPTLATGGAAGLACSAQSAWLKEWHTTANLVTPEGTNRPKYFFYAAYDSHSQLKAMSADLENGSASSAIVLQNTHMLLPVLHHLKDKNVNISMGYPLTHTPFHSLVTEISTLLLRKRPEGQIYWRDLLRLLRHPIVGMLANKDEVSMMRIIPSVDQWLRKGGKYVNLAMLEQHCAEKLTPEELDFFHLFITRMIVQPAQATTTRQLGEALGDICDFLLENGRRIFSRFKLDEEALARVRDNISIMLQDNILANEQFNQDTLFSLLSKLIDQERIPFEAYPLVGTQILGMLETRLLHFDELFILDCSDDFLPGQTPQDPLLPDNLRGLLGLSDSHKRQIVAAHNLFRLCQSAKQVHFYWAEGAVPSAVDTGRRVRSRFMERLIWELEKQKGKLLKPGDDCFGAAQSEASLRPRKPKALKSPEFAQTALPRLLNNAVSASLLNIFMRCPLLFAYKYLLQLEQAPVVGETVNAATLGNCVHQALQMLLEGQPSQPFANDNLDSVIKLIGHCLDKAMQYTELVRTQPVAACMYFEAAAPQILAAYLRRQNKENSEANVLELEKDIEAEIALAGKTYKFRGRVDRIDERNGDIIVLDYKTGAPKTIDYGIWQDEKFFDAMRQALADSEVMKATGGALLDKLREYLPDAQLPVYMLLANATGIVADNAAYVNLLEKDGTEVTLFDGSMDRQEALEKCEIIVGFVLHCIEMCAEFMPRPENCEHCDYTQFCGI